MDLFERGRVFEDGVIAGAVAEADDVDVGLDDAGDDGAALEVDGAGGARGETMTVELRGQDGVTGGNAVIVDGPPGVTVEKVEAAGNNFVKATLKIAADAPLSGWS